MAEATGASRLSGNARRRYRNALRRGLSNRQALNVASGRMRGRRYVNA